MNRIIEKIEADLRDNGESEITKYCELNALNAQKILKAIKNTHINWFEETITFIDGRFYNV